jgi:hypothetical protein
MRDRVESNDESKGTRKIISEGRQQFKVVNKCGTKRFVGAWGSVVVKALRY